MPPVENAFHVFEVFALNFESAGGEGTVLVPPEDPSSSERSSPVGQEPDGRVPSWSQRLWAASGLWNSLAVCHQASRSLLRGLISLSLGCG